MVGLVSFTAYSFLAPTDVVVESLQSDGSPGPIPEPELKSKYKDTSPPFAVPAEPEHSLSSPPVAVEPVPPPPEQRRPAPQKVGGFLWLCGLVLLAATLGALVIRRVRKDRQRVPMAEPMDDDVQMPVAPAPQMFEAPSLQAQMAEQIQAELFRRGIGSA
jgi:hypothetical protein